MQEIRNPPSLPLAAVLAASSSDSASPEHQHATHQQCEAKTPPVLLLNQLNPSVREIQHVQLGSTVPYELGLERLELFRRQWRVVQVVIHVRLIDDGLQVDGTVLALRASGG